ncbi:hypothetical protein ACHAPU_009737 [Fusarium lateritium]
MTTKGTMWLALDKSERGILDQKCPAGAREIHTSPPPAIRESFLEYLRLPRQGRLDWYFNDVRCHVSHHDDSRVPDEMEEVLSREAEMGTVHEKTPPQVVIENLGE